MCEPSQPCAIPRCPHSAVATLRLLIDGDEAVLSMCQSRADWVGAYVEEDADVRLVDRFRGAAPALVAKVVEDVDWADGDTLDVLACVAGGRRSTAFHLWSPAASTRPAWWS